MIISIINLTKGKLSDGNVQEVIRAINRQITDDFEPYWSLSATLRLEGHSGSVPTPQTLVDMRGDAVIYIWDESDVPAALGYHDHNNKGIPYGFVFLDIAEELNEEWSVTLSHEALELIGDPEVNLLVMGPHPDPAQNGRDVFFWYEMCDAVQAETYRVDGVNVSNFILPLYFTGGNEYTGRNDFLGTRNGDKYLESFGVNNGGYVGFFDPLSGDHETYMMRSDKLAKKRMMAKGKVKATRRSVRYQRFDRKETVTYKVTTQKGKLTPREN